MILFDVVIDFDIDPDDHCDPAALAPFVARREDRLLRISGPVACDQIEPVVQTLVAAVQNGFPSAVFVRIRFSRLH